MNGSKSLLLIEDDKDLRLNLEYFLSKIGYELLVAESGEEGIKVWEKRRPRAVLCDVNLPGMNGYSVCEAISNKSISGETTMLLISARPEHELIAGGQRGGADFYITKPTDPVDVGADLYFLFERDFEMSVAEVLKLRVAKSIPKLSKPPVQTPTLEKVTVSESGNLRFSHSPTVPESQVDPTPQAVISHHQNGKILTHDQIDNVSELLLELQRTLRKEHFLKMDHEEVLDLMIDTDRRVDAIIQYVQLLQSS